jgi:uncharacterized protein (TIGR02594 family)
MSLSPDLIGRIFKFLADLVVVYENDFGSVTPPTPPPPGPVQPPAPPIPGPAPPPAPPIYVPAPRPAPVLNGEPPWLIKARTYVGFHEQSNNQGLGTFIALAHCGAEGDPWCAIFANACLESSGFPGTRSALARSFENSADFIKLDRPLLGCITTMWRGSPGAGTGHVTMNAGEISGKISGLGGNQNDQVCIEAFPEDAHITGYWWPKTAPLPGVVAPIPSQRFTGITSTVFGGASDRNTSAYDGHVITDSELGCALPFHFARPPRVRVYANGKSVEVSVCDVGPWNVNDPYWEAGSRPQSESGTDKMGRHTNHAGIDMTPGTVRALGLDPAEGKWTVDWEFVTDGPVQPAPLEPPAPNRPAELAPPVAAAIWTQIDLIGAAVAAIKRLIPAEPAPQPTAAPVGEEVKLT